MWSLEGNSTEQRRTGRRAGRPERQKGRRDWNSPRCIKSTDMALIAHEQQPTIPARSALQLLLPLNLLPVRHAAAQHALELQRALGGRVAVQVVARVRLADVRPRTGSGCAGWRDRCRCL